MIILIGNQKGGAGKSTFTMLLANYLTMSRRCKVTVFRSADLVLCPFSYDELSFESTVLFSVVLEKINPECQLTFIPNRIKANVRYETQLEVDAQLSNFGMISLPIPDRIDVQRVNTFRTPESLLPVLQPVLD